MDAGTNGRGARIVYDVVAGPGLTAVAQTVAADGVLIVYGWLDPGRHPYP